MRLGRFTLTALNGGNFRLDGGAMHGVVPKTLWSKLVSCDELNRVEYATTCLLVEGPGGKLLVETGNGDKLGARECVGGQSVLRSHRLILFTERTVAIVTKAGAYTSHGHLR